VTSREQSLAFVTAAHDRGVDRRHDDGWLATAWDDARSRSLVVGGSSVQVDPASGAIQWLPTRQVPDGERYLLGVDADAVARFAVRRDVESEDVATKGLRELAVTETADDVGWLCHAVALAQWHATHTHCPRCGSPTQLSAAGAERRCPRDGSAHFPRVDPAVIVLVTDAHDRALLGRQGSWPIGRFSTLAGFVEPGESAEQAVRREVAEEADVVVGAVQLLATQPWPFPSSLMIAAAATVEGTSDPHPDGDELAEARWFSREELAAAVTSGEVMVPGLISVSRWLIDRWFGADLPDDGTGWR
jgi:NAD+ diphosphatase